MMYLGYLLRKFLKFNMGLKIGLIISFILFFVTTGIWAQTKLGIGLLAIKSNESLILYFYDDTAKKEPIKTLDFFFDHSINSLSIKQPVDWLNPEILWLDYNYFIFRCMSKTDSWYQVVTNNKTGKSYWLRKDSFKKFVTWQAYLMDVFEIKRISPDMQLIRTKPSDLGKIIDYHGDDCFQIKTIKGDWIEIYTPDYCSDIHGGDTGVLKSGWIKWRHDGELLITYHLTS